MAKPGLYANINKRKKAGTSRSRSKSTISPEAYANMKAGFPKSKKKTAMGGGIMMKKKTKMKTGNTVKPDYLDMDKDGNKKEPMKKAIKEKNKPAKMYGSTVKKPKKMYGSTVKKPKKMGGGMAHSKKKK